MNKYRKQTERDNADHERSLKNIQRRTKEARKKIDDWCAEDDRMREGGGVFGRLFRAIRDICKDE